MQTVFLFLSKRIRTDCPSTHVDLPSRVTCFKTKLLYCPLRLFGHYRALWQMAMSSPVDDVKTPAYVSQPHNIAACFLGMLRNQGADAHLGSWNMGVVGRRDQSTRTTQCCSSAVRAQIVRVNRLQIPVYRLLYIEAVSYHTGNATVTRT